MPGLKWVQIGVGAAAGFALAWLIHLVILAGVNEDHRTAMAAQKDQLEKQCADDAAITKGKNDELQTNLDAVSRERDRLKRVQPARCIIPSSGKADVAGVRQEHATGNGIGISSDWLRDYAATCEQIRLSFQTCTGFVDEVWTSRGQ